MQHEVTEKTIKLGITSACLSKPQRNEMKHAEPLYLVFTFAFPTKI